MEKGQEELSRLPVSVCVCVSLWTILSLLCAVHCPWSGRVRCVLSSAGSGPGYDTVFSVVLMRTLQRSDAGCKCAPNPRKKTLLHSVSLRLRPIIRHERRANRDGIVCDGPRYLFIFCCCASSATRVSMGNVVLSSCAFAVVLHLSLTLSLSSLSSRCCSFLSAISP